MKGKLLKYLVGSLFLLIGLIVVAVVVLPLIIDPNDYKDEIATAVQEQTGRSLDIEGDISLSVFPWLGLDIGPTRLSNAEGFAPADMASMDAVQVRIKLLPLLSKQLEVDTVKLSGLQLNLAKDKRGRTNWADLEGEQATVKDDSERSAGGDEDVGGAALESLAIGGIEVVDAQLVWDDRSSDSRYEVNGLSFTTGSIEPGERFDLDLHFQVAATQPVVTGTFSLKGGVLIASALNAVDISSAELLLDVEGDTIPAGKMTVSLATDIAVDLDKQTLSLPAVVLDTLGMNIAGNISGTKITGDNPQFKGVFTVADFVPRDLIKALGQENPDTADSSVLGNASAKLEWTASTKNFSADVLQVRLDDTAVNGNAGVAQFEKPAISFSLAVDKFDLDRYLPPVPEDAGKAGGKSETASAAKGEAGELPVDALRALNLNGKLTVGSLKAFNLRTTDVEMQVKAKDGLLRINPAGAHLYDGEIRNNITFDVRNKTPRFSLVNDVVSVQAGPLLHDLTGDEKLLGTAIAHASLKGSGSTAEAINRSLNGNVSFSFTDGAIKGVNIASLIRNAQAKLQGQSVPAGEEESQTDFAELRGTAVITNGLIRNDDLSLLSPLLRMSGKGEASLPKETIDYTLTTKIVGSLEGQGGSALGDLKGVSIPVHVGGTFSKPTYSPDLGAALSDVAKEKVKEKVEEQQQKLQEKLGDELQDKLLKGLFN